MKNQLLIYCFLALFVTLTACDDKKSNETKTRTYDYMETKKQYEDMERLLVGKWKYSDIMEEDGLEIIIKGTDEYRSNKEFYSQGSIEIQNNLFSYSMKGTWNLKGNNIYINCENFAGSITNAIPEFNCDYINTQPPTEVVKIDKKEFHFKEEGQTKIAYRVQ